MDRLLQVPSVRHRAHRGNATHSDRRRGLEADHRAGLLSLGLGTTQLLAPGRVNRLIGIRYDARSVVGVQELSAAAGILHAAAARRVAMGAHRGRPGLGDRRRWPGGHGIQVHDRVKQATRMETDRPHALRDAIMACRPGGILSVIGVYGGMVDKFPAGAFMNKGLTMRTGQCPRAAPEGYETFNHKRDECVKVVLKQ